jgi:hypothetical protein
VHDNASLTLSSSPVPRKIRTNAADITLDGPLSQWTDLSTLDTNRGTFTLMGGRTFTTAGTFTNNATVRIGNSSALKVKDLLTNTGTIDVGGALVV